MEEPKGWQPVSFHINNEQVDETQIQCTELMTLKQLDELNSSEAEEISSHLIKIHTLGW